VAICVSNVHENIMKDFKKVMKVMKEDFGWSDELDESSKDYTKDLIKATKIALNMCEPVVSGGLLSDAEKKQKALDKIDAEYYDRSSPHYKDNERYSWAVKVINERFVDCS